MPGATGTSYEAGPGGSRTNSKKQDSTRWRWACFLRVTTTRRFLQVIPALSAGVRVHVHDIFWPFEYPQEWLQEGRFWSEVYLLHALLVGNAKLRIDVFTSYLFDHRRDEIARRAPAWAAIGRGGVSIWLRTRAAIGP